MNNTSEKSKYYVLFVDDEEKTRKAFDRLFGAEFNILLAGDGAEGFQVFQERGDEIGVIVTDQKMPRETGVQFLSKVAEINEDVVRILSTAYAELDAAVEGVNQGGIYRYVTKPWDVPELEITLRRAMELFNLRKSKGGGGASGGGDVEESLKSARVAHLAYQRALMLNPGLGGSVQAGSCFLSLLGTEGADPAGDWMGRYEAELSFFTNALHDSREAIENQTDLDWGRTSPPSAAVQAAAIGCGFNLEFSGSDSSVWPGPSPVLAEVLRPFMVALSGLLEDAPGCTCRIKGNFTSVDFLFSSHPLKSGAALLASGPDADSRLAHLLRALLQIHAQGARISLLQIEESYGLRLEFKQTDEDLDPYAEAAAALATLKS
ncbi:MAG: response regulator [Verrucomicrobiota bacterium JB023]|nr:response regulator [Verrucomicrobiota bacterium JB023]